MPRAASRDSPPFHTAVCTVPPLLVVHSPLQRHRERGWADKWLQQRHAAPRLHLRQPTVVARQQTQATRQPSGRSGPKYELLLPTGTALPLDPEHLVHHKLVREPVAHVQRACSGDTLVMLTRGYDVRSRFGPARTMTSWQNGCNKSERGSCRNRGDARRARSGVQAPCIASFTLVVATAVHAHA